MTIHHLAIWTLDLERQKDFYVKYFGLKVGEKYINEAKKFESYFLELDSGAKLELMGNPGVQEDEKIGSHPTRGLTHFAVSLGSQDRVIALTALLRQDGLRVVSPPRTTGDGFFESCILDPEGNHVELTV